MNKGWRIARIAAEVFLVAWGLVLIGQAIDRGQRTRHEEHVQATVRSIWERVANHRYEASDRAGWKSAEKFFKDGSGDCEDFSNAFLELMRAELPEEEPNLKIALVKLHSGTLHVVVQWRGTYMEPQIYGRVYDPTTDFTVLELQDASYWLWYSEGYKSLGYIE